MKKSTSFIRISLCILSLSIAIDLRSANVLSKPQSGEWLLNYLGTIGDMPIGMTLIQDGDSPVQSFSGKQVTGTYFYVKWLKDIEIKGSVDNERNFVFSEYDKAGNIVSSFKGRFPETDPRGHFANSKLTHEVLIGTWFRAGESDSKPFYLALDNATYRGKGEGRYAAAGVKDDAALEKMARQFREAVISEKKGVVANLISYPIVITIAGKKRTLRSQATLVANYHRIFSRRCVEVIKASVPHNMFVKDEGVMLDSGVVWFGEDGKVIAINP